MLQGGVSKKQTEEKIQKPGYVINIPLVVESDMDTSSDSDSTSDDEEFSDQKHYFEFKSDAAPFQIKRVKHQKKLVKVRGQIDASSIVNSSSLPVEEKSSTEIKAVTKIKKLTKIFKNEAFDKTPKDSIPESKARTALVIGLNRRESLDNKRNKNLKRALTAPLQGQPPTSRIGFFWRPQYEEKTPGSKKWKKVEYSRVKSWFKNLKKRNAKKAEYFRRRHESGGMGEMVPYREIRETIKDHKETKNQIRKMRKRLGHDETFLGVFDGDLQSLRAGKTGTFSHYDKMIAGGKVLHQQAPTVLSTGYKVSEPNNPLLELAVALDLAVRNATARFIKNGIYYPEPNLLLGIEPGADTIRESFCETKDYRSPGESTHIIKHMLKQRKLDVDKAFAFDSTAPIVTETPLRFKQTSVSKKDKKFNGFHNKSGQIILWTKKDLNQVRDTSQSHAKNRDWACNLVAALPIPDSQIINEEKIGKNDLKNMLISLLAKLFNCYDPRYIAKRFLEKGGEDFSRNNFVKQLSYTLKDYSKLSPQKAAVDPVLRSKHINVWKKLDAAEDVSVILHYINLILKNTELTARIRAAAKESGNAIHLLLKEKLCVDFIEYTEAQLEQYIYELSNEEHTADHKIENQPIHEAVLHNTLLDSKNSFNEKNSLKKSDVKKSINAKGKFNLSPLHYAQLLVIQRFVSF